MFGFVHNAFRQLCIRKYGKEVWTQICTAAMMEEESASILNRTYTDQVDSHCHRLYDRRIHSVLSRPCPTLSASLSTRSGRATVHFSCSFLWRLAGMSCSERWLMICRLVFSPVDIVRVRVFSTTWTRYTTSSITWCTTINWSGRVSIRQPTTMGHWRCIIIANARACIRL